MSATATLLLLYAAIAGFFAWSLARVSAQADRRAERMSAAEQQEQKMETYGDDLRAALQKRDLQTGNS